LTMIYPPAKQKLVDLHFHSHFSDGELCVNDLAAMLSRNAIRIAALTDHDTMQGIPAFSEAAGKLGIAVVPGVEISCEVQLAADEIYEVHLLAYFMNQEDSALQDQLAEIRLDRRLRFEKIIEKLAVAGVSLDASENMLESKETQSPGRPHIARAMIKQGFVKNISEAFRTQLSPGKPSFVPKNIPPLARIVELVRAAGGLSILAHPVKGISHDVILKAIGTGIDGLEVRHPGHKAWQTRQLSELAQRNGLSISAGSDFHAHYYGRENYWNPKFPLPKFTGKLGERLRSLDKNFWHNS
jgi:3',5'-nucleoside bisphosphate phosphatase